MPYGRKGSGLKNCIPLYSIHFYKTTDPVRHHYQEKRGRLSDALRTPLRMWEGVNSLSLLHATPGALAEAGAFCGYKKRNIPTANSSAG